MLRRRQRQRSKTNSGQPLGIANTNLMWSLPKMKSLALAGSMMILGACSTITSTEPTVRQQPEASMQPCLPFVLPSNPSAAELATALDALASDYARECTQKRALADWIRRGDPISPAVK